MASRTSSNSVSGEAKHGTDSEQDLSLLLECLHFQQNCVTSQCQALSTIATMCNNSASSRDLLRTSGGLAYVLDLLYNSFSSPKLQQTALYTLGCAAERNLVNQMKLCDRKLFSLLAGLLIPENTPPPLTTTAAYLAGCLMCSNSQGQNMAREERVIHRLIALFKSHLPTHPSSPANSNPTYCIEIWTSVSSALCTATNNPQNEANQSLCSKVFPAALSLLQGRVVEMARPAITLITSCIANNTTTQDRLCMVGGLQILVGSIRELLTHSTLSATDSRDLLMHIVKALSAAAVGHAANCELLCSLETVRLLLALLQNEPFDTSAQVTVVMCLGMLTEDSPTSQKVFKDSDGLNIMLKCLVHSKDEELSKAATFVMQCCLEPAGDSLPSPTAEEQHISASIAKLDHILQPQDVIDDNNGSGDIRGAPVASDINVLNAEALKVLDGQKLPVNDRVSHWLDAYPAPKQSGVLASKEVNMLEEFGRRCPPQNLTQGDHLEVLTQVLSNSACPEPVLLNTTIPLAFLSNPTEFQLENLRTAYLAAKTSREPGDIDNHQKSFHEMKGGDDQFVKKSTQAVEGESQVPSMGTLKQQPERLKGQLVNTPTKDINQALHNTTSQELQREKARREELERELEEEKCKRLKLEQEAALAHEVEHQESRRQKRHGGGSDIFQSQTVSCERGQAGSAKTVRAKCSQESGNVRTPLLEAVEGEECKSRVVVRHPADTSSKAAAAAGGKYQKLSSHQNEQKKAKTPAIGKNNIRYAESSSVFRAPKLPKLETIATAPQKDTAVCKHIEERNKENITVTSQSQLTPIHSISVSSTLYSRAVETCANSNCNDTPLHTPYSLASHAPSMAGCGHKCLGCYPRLKCPLITSRNFVKMLRVDHFTCAYHKRLVNRLANQMDTVPSTLTRPKLIRQQTGMSSSSRHTLHTSYRPVKAQTHSTSATPQCPGSCSQRSAYQKSPPPPVPPSLLSDQQEEQYVYSGSTQVDNTHDSPSPTSPEANIPPPRSYRATTKSSQPIYQYFKPSSTQNRKILNQIHPIQPKAKIPFSKTHSKTPARGSVTLADITNTSHSISNPLCVFDYQTPEKTKASNCKSKTILLPSSNHTEFDGGRRKQVHKARVPFSRQEEENLVAGVRKVGKRWRHILTAYHFHPSRTAVDLKDKYRLLEAKGRA